MVLDNRDTRSLVLHSDLLLICFQRPGTSAPSCPSHFSPMSGLLTATSYGSWHLPLTTGKDIVLTPPSHEPRAGPQVYPCYSRVVVHISSPRPCVVCHTVTISGIRHIWAPRFCPLYVMSSPSPTLLPKLLPCYKKSWAPPILH